MRPGSVTAAVVNQEPWPYRLPSQSHRIPNPPIQQPSYFPFETTVCLHYVPITKETNPAILSPDEIRSTRLLRPLPLHTREHCNNLKRYAHGYNGEHLLVSRDPTRRESATLSPIIAITTPAPGKRLPSSIDERHVAADGVEHMTDLGMRTPVGLDTISILI